MEKDCVNLFDKLREGGYKMTPQRKIILDVIEQNPGKHLSTEEIYDLVRQTHPEVGLATVYRTLLLFEGMDIIHKLDLDDGFSRYELNRNKTDHRHHHLICTICGTVLEVEEDLLESLEQQILKEHGFIVKDHRLKLYGYCEKCSKSK